LPEHVRDELVDEAIGRSDKAETLTKPSGWSAIAKQRIPYGACARFASEIRPPKNRAKRFALTSVGPTILTKVEPPASQEAGGSALSGGQERVRRLIEALTAV
jgi:hypothetical protein